MTILIGGAWPYVNGRLHVGHISSLLPGDVLARYFRIKGEDVLYVSGSDCHGTPISVQADKEKVSPREIADKYHQEITDCFQWLGFSYDLYTRTDSDHHCKIVQEVFLDLYHNGFLYEKQIQQAYCTHCQRFLPDRFVEGTCPKCGQTARGDQCDACSTLLDPLDLLSGHCKLCGTQHEVRETKHLFISLSSFQSALEKYVDSAKSGWRENAVKMTSRYLSEGLKDRAVTRDLTWGIDVPVPGYEGKKIYVWIEAVLGYLSASIQWADTHWKDWREFWNDQTTSYYVHGKDNIPFHSLILPALLLGSKQLHLPDTIVSGEYLTIEGKKISTSLNWAVWATDLKKRYHPDSVRYYLIMNSPENRDTDFSWREFVYQHNSELLGDFGNLVNRTLVFAQKYFDSRVPSSHVSPDLYDQIQQIYEKAGDKIAKGQIKSALEEVFSLIRYANKYFDQTKPWKLVSEDPVQCEKVIFNCIQIIVNLANLLSPFLPHSCEKTRQLLSLEKAAWEYAEIPGGHPIHPPEILFERIDKSRIEEEVTRLHAQLE